MKLLFQTKNGHWREFEAKSDLLSVWADDDQTHICIKGRKDREDSISVDHGCCRVEKVNEHTLEMIGV